MLHKHNLSVLFQCCELNCKETDVSQNQLCEIAAHVSAS